MLTPLDPHSAALALRGAWQQETGRAPSERTAALLFAQWAVETDHGRKMFGHNFGGIKATKGHGVLLNTREGYDASERSIVDRFQTYASVDLGARHYVRTLAERFPGSFEAARVGDSARFAENLAQEGYFTGSRVAYRRAIERNALGLAGLGEPGDASSLGRCGRLGRELVLWCFRPFSRED